MSQDALKLFVVLSRCYKSVMELAEKDIKNFGLTLVEFSILELLYSKGPTPQQRIGNKILKTSGSITYTVDKLEKRGLVQRVSCPKDRRVTYAELTNEGTKLMEDIFPKHSMAIDKIMGKLTTEEQSQAIALLKKLGHE